MRDDGVMLKGNTGDPLFRMKGTQKIVRSNTLAVKGGKWRGTKK